MKVLYEKLTARETPESLMIGQSDDAWHPLSDRDYVEWWYFDVTNFEGSLVRGQFYIIGDVSRPDRVETGVRASLVRPDLTEILIEEKCHYSSFRASTEVCDVEIGRSSIRGDPSCYRVHVEEGEKALDLEFDSRVTGFKGRACFGNESRCMNWVVPQPRSHVRGTFRTKERTFEIEGVGYRDHNWSNISPVNYVACWDWGRIYAGDFTVIFADIIATRRFGRAEVKPLVVYDSDRLIFATTDPTKWTLTKGRAKFDPHTRTYCPPGCLLTARDENLSLDIDLHLDRAFQKIDLLADYNPIARFLVRTFMADPFAISFLSTGPGTIEVSGRRHDLNCTAIHEFVNNRWQRSAV